MKKIARICLILCGVSVVLGILLLGIGTALGARPEQYMDLAHVDRIYEKIYRDKPGRQGQLDYDETFTGDIRELELFMDAGDVRISVMTWEETMIRVCAENADAYFKCEAKEQKLRIEDTHQQYTNDALALTVFLPETEFEKIELEMGAGRLEAQGLCARKLSLEMGAGEMEIHLRGTFEDYDYEIETAVGEVKIGEHSYSGIGCEEKIRNNAAREVEADCAVGSIQISFDDTV